MSQTPVILSASDRDVTQPSTDVYTKRYVWYVVLLLAVVNVFNYMDRMALSVLLPFIKDDLDLSDGQLGLLSGFGFSLFYAVCGIPFGRWADRGVRKNVIAFALTMWSLMTALAGAAQNFWQLFIARLGVGVGESGCLPPSQSLICDYVPFNRRPAMFAIHYCGLYLGMMLGLSLAGYMGETVGWRWAFVILGLPGIAVAMVVKLTLREPRRGRLDAPTQSGQGSSFLTTIEFLWRCRSYRLLIYCAILGAFVHVGINQWLPSFYMRVFDMQAGAVGLYLGVATGVGAAAGMLLGAWLAGKTGQKDVRRPVYLGVIATFAAFPTTLGALFAPSLPVSMIFVFVTLLLWYFPNAALLNCLYGVVQPGMRATAGSVSVVMQALLGFGLGPYVVGMLSDRLTLTYGAESLRYALLAPSILLPVLGVILWFTTRFLREDLKATGARL